MPPKTFGKPDQISVGAVLPDPRALLLSGTASWRYMHGWKRLAAEQTVAIDLRDIAWRGYLQLDTVTVFYLRVARQCVISCELYTPSNAGAKGYLFAKTRLSDCKGSYREFELRVVRTHGKSAIPYRFICPGLPGAAQDRPCGRKVYGLFFPPFPAFDHIACRVCHDLTYLSRQQTRPNRQTRPRSAPMWMLRPTKTPSPPSVMTMGPVPCEN